MMQNQNSLEYTFNQGDIPASIKQHTSPYLQPDGCMKGGVPAMTRQQVWQQAQPQPNGNLIAMPQVQNQNMMSYRADL